MKIKTNQMIALGVGAVALYFLLKPRTAKAATYTVAPSKPPSIQLGPVSIPSAPVANLISSGITSGVNAITGLFTPSSSPLPPATQIALSTPVDQSALQSQIASGFLGFGRSGGSYGRFGLLVAVSR